jgi:hypothetical protein
MKGVKNWKTKKESGIADFKVDVDVYWFSVN